MPTLSITVTTKQANKLRWAFGKQLNTQDNADPDNPVPRDATVGEVEAQIIQFLKGIYHNQDRNKRHRESDNAAGGF